ncbi:bifunctional demethylmenaquinone methyltransferase/2-methoxy-6-polyprenyl-1,4-benzoquinol methylase UbiE [Desulfosarcina sp. OttesenSCG-928-A07]|nr:bifunctional demethylmenaquinone methyltransferase/2-methoxy-6-polyprenyl-1,4-benzoquinol methylase UbiE [Desulfosarcina sp. OttesenSCG-928-G17]MDL2328264.1 bifunctional demethylmenaquinone methyltransferase/2-methoxy-6-polyprenyl-1,4-benzoquinol methylase UbiE [Desulfosarcina sp. OttesenSCG-928-A07]
MVLWHGPRWFDGEKRQEQLDDYIRRTGKARFGVRVFEENKKAGAVRIHFDRVAPKYDFMNSLLSFGIQAVWKRTAVRMLGIRSGDRILDVCGGTGDLSILAASQTGSTGSVTIFDINQAMMAAGRKKIDPFPDRARIIQYVQGNAEALPFPENTFDHVMVGFGIRNLTHLKQGFSEMVRVLRPGGKLLCLEFSRPVNPLFRQLYDFYSFAVMPFLGRVLVGSAESYACLPETIRMFPLPDELAALLEEACGLKEVSWQSMTGGISVAHVGTKP